MNRRKRWAAPLPGAKTPTEPIEIIELMSDDEKAGKPMPLPVELRASGPPIEIVELYPNPLPPPPPPFDRAAALAGIQMAFAALTDDELEVVRLRMLGVPYDSISEELGMLDAEVEKMWKHARRKLGTAMFGSGTASSPETATLVSPDPGSCTEPPQEPEGAAPA